MPRQALFAGLLTAAHCFAQSPTLTVVSAASFAREAPLAPAMIATAFSSAIPEAGEFSIQVRSAAGDGEMAAAIVGVSRGQASFVLPASLPDGPATVTLRRGGSEIAATGSIRIARVSPGLFTANSSGEGAPAGLAIFVDRAGRQRFENLFERLDGSTTLEPAPLNLGNPDEDVYLTLFGTGFRNAPAGRVSAFAGGVSLPVLSSQAQGAFAGLDQMNLGPLPRRLSGRRGRLELDITVDSVPVNRVTIAPTWPPSGAWGTRAALLDANSEMGTVGLNGKIYVIGGYPADRVTVRTVQVYDTAADSWSLAAPLPIGVNHLMPVAHNGRIYVIGGQTDAGTAYIGAVQEYDPATNAWRMRAPMPTARSAGAAVVIDGKIYVTGGRPPRGADFAVYDPAKDEWTALPDLLTQRNHLISVALNGKLHVFGGRFEGGFTSQGADAVEIYDPVTKQWTTGPAMPKPRGGINGVVANGCIHIFGGEFATGVHPDHDVFNPVNGKWTSLANMPVPVHGVTGLHFQDGLIYLPGGGTMQGGSSGGRLHQVYRPKMACQ